MTLFSKLLAAGEGACFCLVAKGETSLWCHTYKTQDDRIYFRVMNGNWSGQLSWKEGKVWMQIHTFDDEVFHEVEVAPYSEHHEYHYPPEHPNYDWHLE